MKKLILLFTFLGAMSSAYAQTVIASGDCGTEGSNVTWTLTSDGVLTISGSGAMADYERWGSRPLWESYESQIKTVIIENGVTTIGNNVFDGYNRLTSVTIPNSVTIIGSDAFWGCTVLTSVTIPNSVTTIASYAFSGCTGLTSVSIPNSVTTIGGSAFSGCTDLTSITIPENVTTIWDSAFFGCTGLTSVSIPNSVTTIGGSAFFGCTGLTSVSIGNSVTTIASYAFASCTGLTSVTIPNSVTILVQNAFAYCSGLTSVTLGNSVATIQERVFYNCSGLTSIHVDTDNQHYSSIDGVLYDKAQETLICCPEGKTGTFIIPNNVTRIGYAAFYNCTGLTSVSIPNSVTIIGSDAFFGCSGLTFVTIPNSVTSIGLSAFYGCSALTSITCKATVPPVIDGSTFENVYRNIPVSVPCGSVAAYQAAAGWKEFTDYSNCITDGIIIPSGVCGANGDNLTWMLIPDGILTIRGIGAMADYGLRESRPWESYRSQIKTVIIENGVTTIGDNAFAICDFTSVKIPESITAIGEAAFSNCRSLISFIIPKSVTAIRTRTFSYCLRLATVTIPNNLTTIGEAAFNGCYKLESITIPDKVTTIGVQAFGYCSSLMSVTIGNSVKTIGNSAFSYCSGLTAIHVDTGNPNFSSLDGILYNKDQSTLACCPAGKTGSITIPSSVTTIGDRAFYGCSALTSIICKAIVPPAISFTTFSEVNKSIPVSVLCGSVEAYQAAAGWNEFTDYSECLDISGISEPEQANALIVYPNPAKEELRIESGELRVDRVEIVDLSGKTVFLPSCGGVGGGFSINVSHLPAGIYLIKIETDKGSVTEKFVKE